MLDCLSIPRAAGWIWFDGHKYTGRKLNVWLIDKGQWIFVREDFLRLNSTGFINIREGISDYPGTERVVFGIKLTTSLARSSLNFD